MPKPVKTWSQCGVSQRILDILKKNNYEKPTPIQAQGIPIVMSGMDMIGIAKTGSGKTLAFLLPLFRHMNAQPELEEGDGPIAIIMTPTRELCMQIGKEIKKFARATKGARHVCVYGGTSISEQIAELKRGAEIIGQSLFLLFGSKMSYFLCSLLSFKACEPIREEEKKTLLFHDWLNCN